MNVYAMKTEITLCDNCKKSIAETKCDICGCDLCKGKRCQIIDEIRLSIRERSDSPNALLCKLVYCAKCKKNSHWQGELSEDLKGLICTKINARKMLKVVEEGEKNDRRKY